MCLLSLIMSFRCLSDCLSAFVGWKEKGNETILTSSEAFSLLCTDLRSNQGFFEDLQTRKTSFEDSSVTWLASHDSGIVSCKFIDPNTPLFEKATVVCYRYFFTLCLLTLFRLKCSYHFPRIADPRPMCHVSRTCLSLNFA